MNDRELKNAIKWAESLSIALHRNSVSVNGTAIPYLEALIDCAKVSIVADKIIDEMAEELSKEVGE